jgi:hypothetical protein
VPLSLKPADHLTFLTAQFGQQLTVAGIGCCGWFCPIAARTGFARSLLGG